MTDKKREQMEEAAFWTVEGAYGLKTWPIDEHAVYGRPGLGDRDGDEIEASVRSASRDLVTAIRTVRPGDRVRVNDRGWMEVTQKHDEGFVAVLENGSVEYVIQPDNPTDRPPGTFHTPWMRKWDGHGSVGEVGCLEVEWEDRE